MGAFKKTDIIILFIVALIGLSVFIAPYYYTVATILVLAILLYLLFHPKYCYFAIVFCIPLIRPNLHYIHLQDILIYVCLAGIIFTHHNIRKLNAATPIDKWLFIVFTLFLLKGITAMKFDRGILYSLRVTEAISLFYMTSFFIRNKLIKTFDIVKVLIFTSMLQGLLGMVQSLANNFGVQEYSTDRGYFGYLGLGSKTVFSGRGTFWHFAPFGIYMTTIFLFFLPFYHYIIKNKTIGKAILACLFAGIVFSYSRGAMSCAILGFIYYLFLIEKDKPRFFKRLAVMSLIITPIILYFSTNNEYLNTLSPRDSIWDIHFQYLKDNPAHLLWGTGFESREFGYFRYVPGHVALDKYLNYNAHNLYLNFLEEMGIFGFFVYLSFLLKIFIDTFYRATTQQLYSSTSRMNITLNTSLHLAFFSIFYTGLNDHVFHNPYMIIFLMLILGIVYANNQKTYQQNIV